MATKGQKFKQWTPEEKYKLIEPLLTMEKGSKIYSREIGINSGLLFAWVKKYREKGMEGLVNKKKPGNPLSKYSSKKNLTKEERFRLRGNIWGCFDFLYSFFPLAIFFAPAAICCLIFLISAGISWFMLKAEYNYSYLISYEKGFHSFCIGLGFYWHHEKKHH